MIGEFQHLGSTRFAGAEASLLWYKDMFDNGRQAVQCQALVQFEEVTQQENWSEAFRARWVLSWYQKGNNMCLPPEYTGKRCVLAHALSRLSTHCIVTSPKFFISSVRISSSPAAFPFFRCFNEFCSSMIVKSSSKSWIYWPRCRLILLWRCLFGILPFRMS